MKCEKCSIDIEEIYNLICSKCFDDILTIHRDKNRNKLCKCTKDNIDTSTTHICKFHA